MSVYFNCLWCGKPKKTTPSKLRKDSNIYCCRKCFNEAKRYRGNYNCPNCGKIFDKQSDSVFCSDACREAADWKEKRTVITDTMVECENPNCCNTFIRKQSNHKYCCRRCADEVKHLKERAANPTPRKPRRKREAPVDPWATVEIYTGDGTVLKNDSANFNKGMWW